MADFTHEEALGHLVRLGHAMSEPDPLDVIRYRIDPTETGGFEVHWNLMAITGHSRRAAVLALCLQITENLNKPELAVQRQRVLDDPRGAALEAAFEAALAEVLAACREGEG